MVRLCVKRCNFEYIVKLSHRSRQKNSIFISNETQQYKPKALTLRLLYITDTTYLSTEEDSMYHIGRSRKCTQYSRCYSVNNQ